MKSAFSFLAKSKPPAQAAPLTASLPDPATAKSAVNLKSGKTDGRHARYTGREKQFNTKVRPHFEAEFVEALEAEAERQGRRLSKAYFLELMLAVWKRDKEKAPVQPFGLSDAAYKGAQLLCKQTGWELGRVIEDAIASRCRDLGVTKQK